MRRTLGILLLSVVLAGCSADDGGAPEPEAKASPTASESARENAAAAVSWTVEGDLIGQPEFAGSAVVAVRRVPGDQLEIFGVETDSGKELWSQPLSPGAASTGFEVGFEVIEAGDRHQVGFFAPARTPVGTSEDEWWTPVVVVDAESGDELYRSPAVWATEPLDDCEGDPGFCVVALRRDSRDATTWQIDGARRSVALAPKALPDAARPLASDGLYSTNQRPGERIGRWAERAVGWEVPVEKAFGGLPVSSDGGWDFDYVSGENLFVGKIGPRRPDDGDRPTTWDFSGQAGGALDGASGETLWSGPGLDPTCGPASAENLTDGGPVRCRLSGQVDFSGDEPVFDDLEVTVEGYDLRTGKTTWAHEVVGKTAEALAWGGPAVVSSGGGIMVVETDRGRQLLETSTGRLTAVTDEDRFLCAEPVEFRYHLGWRHRGETTHDRYGGDVAFACDGELEPVSAHPSMSALRDGALWATESTYVVGTKDGLVGYRAP